MSSTRARPLIRKRELKIYQKRGLKPEGHRLEKTDRTKAASAVSGLVPNQIATKKCGRIERKAGEVACEMTLES